MKRTCLLAGLLGLATALGIFAQGAQQSPAAPAPSLERPAARPEDVKSLEAILAAVYDVISGPAGERDGNRFRSLFVAGARLIRVVKNDDGSFAYRAMTVEEYIQRLSENFRKSGFYVRDVSHRTEQFGQIAHVFTTHESRETPGAKPFARGINSMQFFFDGKRWWCVTIFWDDERPENPIPDRYLAK